MWDIRAYATVSKGAATRLRAARDRVLAFVKARDGVGDKRLFPSWASYYASPWKNDRGHFKRDRGGGALSKGSYIKVKLIIHSLPSVAVRDGLPFESSVSERQIYYIPGCGCGYGCGF